MRPIGVVPPKRRASHRTWAWPSGARTSRCGSLPVSPAKISSSQTCELAVSAASEPVAWRQLSLRAKVCVVVRVDAATATSAAIAQTATTSSSR